MKCQGMAIGAGLFAFALLVGAREARAQAAITRVSVDSNGNEGTRPSGGASISADGRFVAFSTDADDLVANDTNQTFDVFVHDNATGATVRVSVDSTGAEGDGGSYDSSLSADGRFVAFDSWADNLVAGDVDGDMDVFLHDRDPDGNGVFDEGNGTTSMVSVNRFGQPPLYGASRQPSICADGHLVAFSSSTSGLIFGDTNGRIDVFVRDLATGTTTRVSVDSNGNEARNGDSQDAHLSEDGSAVSFDSRADNLVGNDTNGRSDVFVRDLVHGTTTRVSVDSAGNEGNDDSYAGPITADGALVVFDSDATNLVANDTNHRTDVFLHDLASGTTERVSVDSTGGQVNSSYTYGGAISGDGALVAFTSNATTLAAGNPNGFYETFVKEQATGRVAIASCLCGEAPAGNGWFGAFSHDGEFVAFSSDCPDLVSGDNNLVEDVFVLDRAIDAPAATTYGSGYPGANGIPTLTVVEPAAVGTTFHLAASDSSAAWTIGFLLIGTAQASTPTGRGGTILVAAPIIVPFVVPPPGASLAESIPFDPLYAGALFDLQVVEADPGAQYGLSFTAGLELKTGR